MALITLNEISQYYGIDAEDQDTKDVFEALADRVSDLAETYCNRIFTAADYTEYHNGGRSSIFIKNPPINSLSRVAIGRQDVIYVYNSAEYTTAFVSVTSNGITLTKDGTSDSACLFASYTTMTTMVDAINAVGNSWVAVLVSTDFSNYQSTELIPRHPANALDNTYVYLQIPEEAMSEYEVNDDAGIIYPGGKIQLGRNIVRVDYGGGFETIPGDIKQVLIQEVIRWDKEAKSPHIASSTSKDTTTTYISKELMPQTLLVLDKYRIRPVNR